MELQTFISQTLVQIAKGIEDATNELKETTCIVNPKSVSGLGKGDMSVYGFLENDGSYKRAVQEITFDLAVSATEGKQTKGGIGIVVGAIALGSQGKSDKESSSYSRIQFKIPMALPITK